MIRKVLSSAFIILTFWAPICVADADTNSWLRLCNSPGILETRQCNAYLQGFAGGHSITVALPSGLGFCTPDGTTVEQVRLAVVTYAQRDFTRKMLEQSQFSTNMLIYLALADAFPCRSPGNSSRR